MNFDVFGNVVKHSPEYLIYLMGTLFLWELFLADSGKKTAKIKTHKHLGAI